MKRIAILLAFVIFVVTGCRMTPEEPVVMSKRDEAFEKMVLVEAPDVDYDFPEHYKDSFKGKDRNINIKIDAKVVVPNVLAFPVVKVKPLPISEKMTKHAADVFMEGRCGYYPCSIMTKSEIESDILESKARIADRDGLMEFCDGDEETVEGIIDRREAYISRLREMLKTAPDEQKSMPANFVFQSYEFYTRDSENEAMPSPCPSPEVMDDRQSMYFISEDKLSDGLYSRFRVSNEYGRSEISLWDVEQHEIQFYKCYSHMGIRNLFSRSPFNENGGDGDIGAIFTKIRYTKDEAKQLAEKALKDMNMEGYCFESFREEQAMPTYDELTKQYESQEQEIASLRNRPVTFYLFVYRPVVNGVPILRANTDYADNDMYCQNLLYEKVVVRIANEGVVEFTWINPMDRKEVINPNVKLISFDKAMAQAKKFMQITYNTMSFAYIDKEDPDWQERLDEFEGGLLQVNNIKLGMARIPIYNKVGEYMMIPVWNFYGAHEIIRKDRERWSEEERNKADKLIISINAIDGSVIRQRYHEDY